MKDTTTDTTHGNGTPGRTAHGKGTRAAGNLRRLIDESPLGDQDVIDAMRARHHADWDPITLAVYTSGRNPIPAATATDLARILATPGHDPATIFHELTGRTPRQAIADIVRTQRNQTAELLDMLDDYLMDTDGARRNQKRIDALDPDPEAHPVLPDGDLTIVRTLDLRDAIKTRLNYLRSI